MFCTNCGKQLKDGAKFCPYCGQKQKERTPVQETVEAAPEVITGVSEAKPEKELAPKPEPEPVIEPILDTAKDRIESLPEAEESKPEPEIIETKTPPFVSEETVSQSEDTEEIHIDPVSAMPNTAESISEENSPQTEPQETSCQPPLRWESAAAPKEELSTPVSDDPPKRPPWKLISILAAVVLAVITAVSVFFSIYNAPIRKFELALNSADYSTAAVYYGNGSLSSDEQANADKLINDLVTQAVEDYNNGLASYESVSEWLDQMNGSFGELKGVSAAQVTLNELKASKDQFQQAASAEAAGGAYTALTHYSNVAFQDLNYEKAQEKIEELNVNSFNRLLWAIKSTLEARSFTVIAETGTSTRYYLFDYLPGDHLTLGNKEAEPDKLIFYGTTDYIMGDGDIVRRGRKINGGYYCEEMGAYDAACAIGKWILGDESYAEDVERLSEGLSSVDLQQENDNFQNVTLENFDIAIRNIEKLLSNEEYLKNTCGLQMTKNQGISSLTVDIDRDSDFWNQICDCIRPATPEPMIENLFNGKFSLKAKLNIANGKLDSCEYTVTHFEENGTTSENTARLTFYSFGTTSIPGVKTKPEMDELVASCDDYYDFDVESGTYCPVTYTYYAGD